MPIPCTSPIKKEPLKATIPTAKGDIPINAGRFLPDWSMRNKTAKQLEEELEPFEFKGLGWYILKGTNTQGPYENAMLITPASNTYLGVKTDNTKAMAAIETGEAEQIFNAYVWNDHDALHTFAWIANAPTRVDER